MKKLSIFALCLLLPACTNTITKLEIDQAIQSCLTNGGLTSIQAVDGTTLRVKCNNGATFEKDKSLK